MQSTALAALSFALLVVCGTAADAEAPQDHPSWALLEPATLGKNEKVIAALESGIDVNVKSPEGESALHTACIYGHLDTIELLLARGADVNARSNDQAGLRMAPLHWCVSAGYTEASVLLVKHGADVNMVVDTVGGPQATPVTLAVKYTREETAQALRALGGLTFEELEKAEL